MNGFQAILDGKSKSDKSLIPDYHPWNKIRSVLRILTDNINPFISNFWTPRLFRFEQPPYEHDSTFQIVVSIDFLTYYKLCINSHIFNNFALSILVYISLLLSSARLLNNTHISHKQIFAQEPSLGSAPRLFWTECLESSVNTISG